jgi:pyridoxal/pyridoxine/pyridoxamine kinase
MLKAKKANTPIITYLPDPVMGKKFTVIAATAAIRVPPPSI